MLTYARSHARTASLLPRLLRTFTFFLCLSLATPAPAEDTAILWDISKSVPKIMYDERVRNSVRDLVAGRGLTADWAVTRPSPIDPALEEVLTGRRPMLRQKNQLLLVLFGSLNRNSGIKNLPFTARELRLDEGVNLDNELTQSFPTKATDDWTNKNLAEAVAARYFYDRKSPAWFTVVISDFNEDNKIPLTQTELEFVDTYETELFASTTRPVVLRLKADTNVIMKLRRMSSKSPPATSSLPELPSRLLETLTPRNGSKLQNGKQVVFSWRWNDKKTPSLYQVVISPTGGGTSAVLSAAGMLNTATTTKPLAAGQYRWQVFAMLDQGSVASQPLTFTVEGDGSLWWILAVLLSAAAAGGLVYLNARRRRERMT